MFGIVFLLLSCRSSFLLPSDSSSSSSSLRVYSHPHSVGGRRHFDSTPDADIDVDTEVERTLRQQIKEADEELEKLMKSKQHVDHHIHVLHEYNEIKDVVQSLLGQCAVMEGRTTKDMYVKFGLELED